MLDEQKKSSGRTLSNIFNFFLDFKVSNFRLQSAPSSMKGHLMWARFMVDLNIGRITEKISLLLCENLVFRNMVLMWRLNYLKLRKIEALFKYNYLKINKLRQYFSNFVMY